MRMNHVKIAASIAPVKRACRARIRRASAGLECEHLNFDAGQAPKCLHLIADEASAGG